MAEPSSSGRTLGDGAAAGAPTAPHATPPAAGSPRRGPERFWSRRPARVAFALALVVSAAVHLSVLPLGAPSGFEVRDVEGVAAIPVDVLEAEPEPAPPPPPPAAEEAKPASDGEKGRPFGPTPRPDGGAPQDASPDAPKDAAGDMRLDAYADAAGGDGAVPLDDDAGAVATGPRDPQAVVGAAGDIQADVVLVMLVVNAEVIRLHPEGARMSALLRGVKQWNDFMSGTDIDPLKDTDWIMISGPSLVNTSRDVVLIRYSAPDTRVEHAMDVVARGYAKGGDYDAGVPGVKAVRSYADGAERVVMRPHSHVLAVVPPAVAPKVARQLARSSVPAHVRRGEAAYLRLVNPHHPLPEIPEAITEARMRVVPRDDEGADVFIDCDTKDGDAARQAAEGLRAVIRRRDDIWVSMVTHGLLDHVDVATEGNLVKVHLTATRDQIATMTTLVGSFLGVEPPVGAGRPGPRTPPPPSGAGRPRAAP